MKTGSAIQDKLEKMETFFDRKECLVLDNGTGFVKAGFSGEDMPRVSFLFHLTDCHADCPWLEVASSRLEFTS